MTVELGQKERPKARVSRTLVVQTEKSAVKKFRKVEHDVKLEKRKGEETGFRKGETFIRRQASKED